MRLRHLIRMIGVVAILAQSVLGQLHDGCTVSVMGQSTRVRPDGSWILPELPAGVERSLGPRPFSPITLDFFPAQRARAICVQNGQVRVGESSLFDLTRRGAIDVPPIQLGNATPIPTAIFLSSTSSQLTQQTRTGQLTVTGVYEAGQADITRIVGTTFRVSNPQIATISNTVLVTAVSSGTVVIQAFNEGAQGLLPLQVILSGDSDGDGLADDLELREGMNPRDPTDALLDFDNDGLSNRQELIQFGTRIRDADTDKDGLTDGQEINGLNGFTSEPLVVDTDSDGVNDFLEVTIALTDPRSATSVNYGASISRIEVSPSSFSMTIGGFTPAPSVQLRVNGIGVDNSLIDLTPRNRGTNYTSSNGNCQLGTLDGQVLGNTVGGCSITATNGVRSSTVLGQVQASPVKSLSRLSLSAANDVKVRDGYAYVADGSAGLVVVNVSDPRNPFVAAIRDTPRFASGIDLSGNFAYIADGFSGGLVTMDISNPLSPVIVGTVAIADNAVDVMVQGNFAYIASENAGLVIVDVTNPSVPRIVSTVSTGGSVRSVFVRQNIAAVVSGTSNTLRTFNISNPAAPVALASIVLPGDIRAVHLEGNLAVVASARQEDSAQFVDLTNPSSPRLIKTFPSGRFFGSWAANVAGTTSVLLAFPTLQAFDVSDTANPRALGELLLPDIVVNGGFGARISGGIAISGPYGYVAFSPFESGGIGRNSAGGGPSLYIVQLLPETDTAGRPPKVTITLPGETSRIQGERVTISAEASDDIAVNRVNFLVNGSVVFTDTSAPFQYAFDLPNSTSLSLSAEAFDLAGNRGTAVPLQITLSPDPLTTVQGQVFAFSGHVNGGNAYTSVGGATVVATGGAIGTSDSFLSGRFSIPGVRTANTNVSATASLIQDGQVFRGSSSLVPAIRGGTTSLGQIYISPVIWEPTSAFICPPSFPGTEFWQPVTLGFPFPFFGQTYNQIFANSKGNITFGEGDSSWSESVSNFSRRPRIAGFLDDLFARSGGGAMCIQPLMDRVVITYENVAHFDVGGSNTIQMILFSDGRIQFGYRGITSTNTGTIVGITPGPNAPRLPVDFSRASSFAVPAGSAVFESFVGNNVFDLENSFIVFTPLSNGGYTVTTTTATLALSTVLVSGRAKQAAISSTERFADPEDEPLSPSEIGNAEVEIRSSTDVAFVGYTNTDRRGNFSLSEVPAGGISVIVRKNGKVVATGTAIANRDSTGLPVRIDLQRPKRRHE